MSLNQHEALDSIDRFIQVGRDIAKLPLLANPEFLSAAEALYLIAHKLLISNENMARWLNKFLQFDFGQPGAPGQFKELARDFQTMRSGQGFYEMKFKCGDIRLIYRRDIEAKLPDLFPTELADVEVARQAFVNLGVADDDMVAYVVDGLVSGLDDFVGRIEKHLGRSDLNGAETERLRFKVASRELSSRLVHFANQLADLVLTYAGLAQRSVTLADDPSPSGPR